MHTNGTTADDRQSALTGLRRPLSTAILAADKTGLERYRSAAVVIRFDRLE
jgi:hypothetical protein